MAEHVLTDRQRREQEFYEEYSNRNAPTEVNFDPVVGDERRPWNSYWRFIELVQTHFTSEGQRLLDFGCGTGFYSLIFARIGYEVFGFDIAPNNIAIANRLSEKYGLRHKTHFSVSTAETLDYEDEFFDVVTGINILHHVDINSSVAECLRVLKPGGIAMFHEPVRAPLFDVIRESPLGTRLVSKEASFDRHITPDERKLNGEDLKLLAGLMRAEHGGERRLEPSLDPAGIGEVVEVKGSGALRRRLDGLRLRAGGALLALLARHQIPEVPHQADCRLSGGHRDHLRPGGRGREQRQEQRRRPGDDESAGCCAARPHGPPAGTAEPAGDAARASRSGTRAQPRRAWRPGGPDGPRRPARSRTTAVR